MHQITFFRKEHRNQNAENITNQNGYSIDSLTVDAYEEVLLAPFFKAKSLSFLGVQGKSKSIQNTVYNFWYNDLGDPRLNLAGSSTLQSYSMYSQFFMLCPQALLLPTLPTIPAFQGYPCSLFTYTPVSLENYPEIEAPPSSSEQCSVKEEEVSSRQPSESTGKPVSRFKYAKKNVQSNVVNQCFSYLTTKAKSYPVLASILSSEEKIDAFYEIMKQAKKKNNKYMGRGVLESLLQLDDDHPVYILHKKLKFRVSLKLSEVRHALRVMTAYFLRSLIVPTILTSSKMDRTTIRQHLTRVREIQRYLSRGASPYS